MVTDEVMNQRRYGALPLSYGATSANCAGGIRTHNPRVMSHVLQSGSRSLCVGDEGWSELPAPKVSDASGIVVSGGVRNRTMYSNPAVAVVLLPNEG